VKSNKQILFSGCRSLSHPIDIFFFFLLCLFLASVFKVIAMRQLRSEQLLEKERRHYNNNNIEVDSNCSQSV
jgi:hypothetical protein